MLLRFAASNHRSLREPVELSMIAVDEDRPSAYEFDLLDQRVLAVAGIYGPNASGKSNVLEALAWLSDAVKGSLRSWDQFIPREPFKFGLAPQTPSTYEVEMMVNGVRFVYRLEVDDAAVLFEGLYSYPERRRRVLFEREGLEVKFRRGLGSLAGTRELLTTTTLALSAAMRFDEPEVEPFARSLEGVLVFGLRGKPPWRRMTGTSAPLPSTRRLFESVTEQASLFDESPKVLATRESALELLRFADLGIDEVTIARESLGARSDSVVLRLVHRVAGEGIAFDFDEESAGTQTWFNLIGPTLRALEEGQVVLLDEIDSSLHPQLPARLVELFQDPQTNPNRAQLVFTTHDTSLLNHLNRDEVWLTEKGADGATTLIALAEYRGDKVRRSLNLERAYLQGRFGAVPQLDQYRLRRALGVASNG